MSWRRLLLLLVLAWCGLFAALEAYRTTKLYINRPWSEQQPSLWRLGSDPVTELRSFTSRIDQRLSESTRLAFASTLEGEEGHILHMWVAYLLPRHDVLAAQEPASASASYWLSYGSEKLRPPPADGASLLYAEVQGALYRLQDGGRSEESPH